MFRVSSNDDRDDCVVCLIRIAQTEGDKAMAVCKIMELPPRQTRYKLSQMILVPVSSLKEVE